MRVTVTVDQTLHDGQPQSTLARRTGIGHCLVTTIQPDRKTSGPSAAKTITATNVRATNPTIALM